MRDKLIPEEKIMAIQEQLSGFIVEQVLDPKGEFYYDGLSNIDNRHRKTIEKRGTEKVDLLSRVWQPEQKKKFNTLITYILLECLYI